MQLTDESRLRTRWTTPEGKSAAKRVLNAVRTGADLRGAAPFDKYEGRWDLRGLSIPPLKIGAGLKIGNTGLNLVSNLQRFRNTSLADVDLSYATLNDSAWDRCRWSNARFSETDLQRVGLWDCTVEDCVFSNCNLRDSTLGGHIGKDTSEFLRVEFRNSDLEGTVHGFASYERCTFRDCNLFDVDFDGARFKHCGFTGLLEAVAFRLHARILPKPLVPLRRVDPKKFTNPMEHVDFSGSVLRGVDFDGVDLSTCVFPRDNVHLVVTDQNSAFRKLREVVAAWKHPSRETALPVIEAMFLDPEKLEGMFLNEQKLAQPIQLVNRDDFIEWFGREAGEAVFEALGVIVGSAGR